MHDITLSRGHTLSGCRKSWSAFLTSGTREHARSAHSVGVMDTSTPAIVAEHLCKRYRDRVAVDDISFTLGVGETLGIIGTNGAGKTTAVEMVAGLRSPDGGRVRVLGVDPHRDRAHARQLLGVQLQEATLHGALTVAELVRLYRTFYPAPVGAAELLEMVGLTEQRGTRFEKLSGGQQQRLSIALALAGRPRVVILDELTTGLDPRARRQMWETVERLRHDNVAVLLVSHAMEEVERLCDRVALLDAGRLVALDTPPGLVAAASANNLDEAFVALTGKELEDTV